MGARGRLTDAPSVVDAAAMNVVFSEEVRAALADGRAVVALETSVVAQGLPHPHNLATAQACEEAVRRTGAVPATVAVFDGVLRAGLTRAEVERLGDPAVKWPKLGSRDLAIAVAQRTTGATTVSATCDIAALAGIRVFATGGIGGVHRGVVDHFDVSQDLMALARRPVAVVCAGAKSVLDLPKTLEMLETLAVPVVGVGTRELPSFFSTTSGLPLEHSVAHAREAARIVAARRALGDGGTLFAQPPPAHLAIPAEEVETWVAEALAAAEAQGVRGKAVTPFLLGALSKRSQGRTLATNLALLENNARFAGELAVAIAADAR